MQEESAISAFAAAGGAERQAPAGGAPMRRLLQLLQGEAAPALADVRLARLPRPELETLSHLAWREADTCVQCSGLLLRLLEAAARHARPDAHLVLQTTQHAARLLKEQQVWRELACNAAYYCDHPEATARLRRLLDGDAVGEPDRAAP
ncbi:hypothetical protein LDO32_05295 [Luteimonas sp. Y-2-2-4F]|nr:hypothetical protein [Luteimonas sp. Y-2-2-4F]